MCWIEGYFLVLKSRVSANWDGLVTLFSCNDQMSSILLGLSTENQTRPDLSCLQLGSHRKALSLLTTLPPELGVQAAEAK